MADQAEKEHGLPIMGDLKDLYESGITQIPAALMARKPNAYKPHKISLGPLHFDGSQLEYDEGKKKQLLQDRFPYRVRHIEELVDRMNENLSRIRDWYHISDSLQEPQEPGKLCSMMALDGIFLLEFLREISLSDYRTSISSLSISSFREQRHAFRNQEVQEDILKLQNQIPLFALNMIIQWEENLYQAVTTMPQQEEGIEQIKMLLEGILFQATNQDLDTILKRAWHSLSPFDVGEEPLISPGENAHLLGFVYANILGESTDPTGYDGERNQKKTLPTAVVLDNKGVKFAVYSGPLNKIRFDRITWTLHLPRIEIAERTDAVMRNLMAFEFLGPDDRTKPIKCYVELMDQLINTAEDVQVLKNCGIIHHHLGTDQEVADIWNKMREGHDQEDKYGPIDIAIDEVIKFYGSYGVWISEAVKKFFSKPWLVVSFIAGCIIVITAIVQTIFSGLQLHHH